MDIKAQVAVSTTSPLKNQATTRTEAITYFMCLCGWVGGRVCFLFIFSIESSIHISSLKCFQLGTRYAHEEKYPEKQVGNWKSYYMVKMGSIMVLQKIMASVVGFWEELRFEQDP